MNEKRQSERTEIFNIFKKSNDKRVKERNKRV